MSLKMQVLDLDFVETIMKMGRKRTVIHTVHYKFGLRSYKDSCGHIHIISNKTKSISWNI